jgi:hypothetical protein
VHCSVECSCKSVDELPDVLEELGSKNNSFGGNLTAQYNTSDDSDGVISDEENDNIVNDNDINNNSNEIDNNKVNNNKVNKENSKSKSRFSKRMLEKLNSVSLSDIKDRLRRDIQFSSDMRFTSLEEIANFEFRYSIASPTTKTLLKVLISNINELIKYNDNESQLNNTEIDSNDNEDIEMKNDCNIENNDNNSTILTKDVLDYKSVSPGCNLDIIGEIFLETARTLTKINKFDLINLGKLLGITQINTGNFFKF